MASKSRYDAFISYSHGASGALAKGLQTWLQAYAKPWWRRRAISVFRDETDLSISPGLWTEIESALDLSDWFVLIATPQAAASKWVKREVRFWLGDREPLKRTPRELDEPIREPDPDKAKRIVIVVGEGDAVWNDGEHADFNWRKTTALPKCLSGVFDQEPLWLDLRKVASEAKSVGSIGGSNPQFMDAVARISSRVRSKELSALIGEDARQHRRTRQLVASAVGALTALTVAASTAAWIARLAADAADKQRGIAEAERQVAVAQSLVDRSPANLPKAGLLAAGAFRQMQLQSRRQIAPEWLHSVLQWSGLSQLAAFSPLQEANAYRADSERTRAALAIVETANNLVPSLVASTAAGSRRSASHIAFLDNDAVAIEAYGNRIDVFNSTSGISTREIFIEPPVYRINGRPNEAYSGDGRKAAFEQADGLVRIVSISDGAVMHTIDPRQLFDSAAFEPQVREATNKTSGIVSETFTAGGQSGTPLLAGLAFSYLGDILLIVTRGGQVMTLSLSNGVLPIGLTWTMRVTEPGSVERISELALNDSGEFLAVACSTIQGQFAPVEVFGAFDGQRVTLSTGLGPPVLNSESMVNALAFEPRANRLAVATEDGGIGLWDIVRGNRERVIPIGAAVESIAFGRVGSEGYLLAGTGDGMARVYEIINGREVARAPHKGRIDSVAWDTAGTRFATGAVLLNEESGDTLRVWTFAPRVFRPSAPHDPKPSYNQIATSGKMVASIEYPNGLAVWNSETGALVTVIRVPPAHRLPFVLNAENGTATAAATNAEGLAYVYNLKTGTARVVAGPGLSVSPVVEEKRFISDLAFDAKGSVMARVILPVSDANTCEVEVWSLDTSAKLDAFDCGARSTEIALKPDGNEAMFIESVATPQIVVRSIGGKAEIWRKPLNAEVSTLVGKRIGYSRDGRRAAVGGKRSAMVFDSANGDLIGSEKSYAADVIDIALSADGSLLAATLDDRTVVVSDATTAEVMRVFDIASDTTGGGGLAFDESGGELFATLNDSSFSNRKIWQWTVDPTRLVEQLEKRLNAFPEFR